MLFVVEEEHIIIVADKWSNEGYISIFQTFKLFFTGTLKSFIIFTGNSRFSMRATTLLTETNHLEESFSKTQMSSTFCLKCDLSGDIVRYFMAVRLETNRESCFKTDDDLRIRQLQVEICVL